MHRRLPRARLVEAVAPASLASALENLCTAGVLAGFEERGGDVLVWGNLTALDCALDLVGQESDSDVPAITPRGDYYRAAEGFAHDPEFRALPARARSVWRLHSRGASNAQIADELELTLMTVRYDIRRCRLAAGLPAVTSTMRRGGGPGRPRRPDSERSRCTDGCERFAVARGLCMAHYLRRWRSSKVASDSKRRAA